MMKHHTQDEQAKLLSFIQVHVINSCLTLVLAKFAMSCVRYLDQTCVIFSGFIVWTLSSVILQDQNESYLPGQGLATFLMLGEDLQTNEAKNW